MNTAEQLSKCAESLRTVKAQLDKQIVNLKRYQTSLMNKHDVQPSVQEIYRSFIRNLEMGPDPSLNRGFNSLYIDPVTGTRRLQIPERILNYRAFNVATMCGPTTARLIGYQLSMNKVLVSRIVPKSVPTVVDLALTFVNNDVIQEAIASIASKVCPKLKECDFEYWHSPLLESVLGLCNGVLKSIGLEYLADANAGHGMYVELRPQYPDEVAYPLEASLKSLILTLVDALQLRELLTELIALFTQDDLDCLLKERL
jgi:hypothetical protein